MMNGSSTNKRAAHHAGETRHATKSCARVRLAQSSVAAVDSCGCGTVQVHIGPTTLHFTEAALSSLLSTLGEAVTHLAARKHARFDAAHHFVSVPGGDA